MPENFQKLVIETLAELRKDIIGLKKIERSSADKITEEIYKLKVEMAMMKVKASFLGGVGGLIAIAVLIGVEFLSKK